MVWRVIEMQEEVGWTRSLSVADDKRSVELSPAEKRKIP
jgi:hypothetical protein